MTLILSAACLVRLLLLAVALHVHGGEMKFLYWQDSLRLFRAAAGLLSGGRLADLFDVPLYPVFLACFFKLFGVHRLYPPLLNIALCLLSAFLVYRLAEQVWAGFGPPNPRGARDAAALFAFYPTVLVYSVTAVTEFLFIALVLSSLLLLLRFFESGRGLPFSAVLLGLATFTKEAGLFLPGVYAVLLAVRMAPKRALRCLAAFLVVYAAVLFPAFILHAVHGQPWTLSRKSSLHISVLKANIERPVRESGGYLERHVHFYGGTGIVSAMRLLGHDPGDLTRAAGKPRRLVSELLKSPGWMVYQLFAHLYTLTLYAAAAFSLAKLVRTGRFFLAAALGLPVLYFISVYFFPMILTSKTGYLVPARYFLPALPFLAILAAGSLTARPRA